MFPSPPHIPHQEGNYQPPADPPMVEGVDSDVVVILAALLCALICVVGLALVARCAWIRRSSTAAPQMPPNKGLKKKVLRSLPKLSFSRSALLNDDKLAADCSICLSEFVDGDQIRVLPQCSHVFHVGCVDTWLLTHSSCPSCRQNLAVARCQKCGELPPPEGEVKAREDDANRFLP